MPPLMTLETTGAGRARYNPNLYADGKARFPNCRTMHLLHPAGLVHIQLVLTQAQARQANQIQVADQGLLEMQ